MKAEAALKALLGARVTRLSRPHGGDLSDVYQAELVDGRRVVAKTGSMVEAEARMLEAMARSGAAVPAVLATSPGLVALEFLPETGSSPEGWRALGVALAKLHGTTGASYGWEEDYAFGPVGIPNSRMSDWPAFWAERRLLPCAAALPGDARTRLERLCLRLSALLPASPPASLLHGDLWSGNALFSGRAAYMIDPACYHGDGEVDLAMLSLFGAPPPTFLEGYGSLRPGAAARRPIYQLWPALVHLRLFGAGYLGLVSRLLDEAGA